MNVPTHPRTKALKTIKKMARESEAIEIVVGLPKHLSGAEGSSAEKVRSFARQLAAGLPEMRISLLDERRTTVQAKERLRSRGIDERNQREIIDQVAAQIILEQALEIERLSMEPPGETVTSESNAEEG